MTHEIKIEPVMEKGVGSTIYSESMMMRNIAERYKNCWITTRRKICISIPIKEWERNDRIFKDWDTI